MAYLFPYLALSFEKKKKHMWEEHTILGRWGGRGPHMTEIEKINLQCEILIPLIC